VPVSGVSPHVEGMASPGKSGTWRCRQVNDGLAAIASDLSVGQLPSGDLAMVAGSLGELGLRADRFRGRLSGLETAAQSASGRTSRSTRDWWWPCVATSAARRDAGQLTVAVMVAELNRAVGPILGADLDSMPGAAWRAR
jgi:hypothetical protein